ncbi:MAG: M20/M25/M40 family metallo-hydrolase [Firmicutes bacterium]|nr:M20/M25/M40 family metallo-hydrolase [Bacillota bacterium]
MVYEITPSKCAEHLSGAVKFATLSKDHEADTDWTPFFGLHDYILKTYPLIAEKLDHEVVGKAGLLFHWKGTGKSKALPVYMMAHMDVVPEGDWGKWTYPPYEGVIADGHVWGRGASDCKAQMIAQLEAVEHLLSEGYQPDYDIYMAYCYNEEVAGGDSLSSAQAMADHLTAKGVKCGITLDEGGGMRAGSAMEAEGRICSIAVGEKGYVDFEIYRLDEGGHSSTPHHGGALDYVAEAIIAIRDHQLPYRITPAVKARFEALAPVMKDKELGRLFSDIEGNWNELLPIIDKDPKLAAYFHTTLVPTMAQGSQQGNILPEKASVGVNSRLLQGDTVESITEYLKSIIPEGMEVIPHKGHNPTPCGDVENDAAQLLYSLCKERYGEDITLVPDVMLGGTDSKFLYGLSDNVYRFGPFFNTKGESTRAHQVNENMDCETLAGGAEFMIDFIKKYGK